jgi:hypothetical protein
MSLKGTTDRRFERMPRTLLRSREAHRLALLGLAALLLAAPGCGQTGEEGPCGQGMERIDGTCYVTNHVSIRISCAPMFYGACDTTDGCGGTREVAAGYNACDRVHGQIYAACGEETDCGDGVDNDCDWWVDNADAQCGGAECNGGTSPCGPTQPPDRELGPCDLDLQHAYVYDPNPMFVPAGDLFFLMNDTDAALVLEVDGTPLATVPSGEGSPAIGFPEAGEHSFTLYGKTCYGSIVVTAL